MSSGIERARLRVDQLSIGSPLKFDVYDLNGRLLLRRGNVITNGNQLERLIQGGLYADAVPAASRESALSETELQAFFAKSRTATAARAESPFTTMTEVCAQLEPLLDIDVVPTDFALKVRGIADTIRSCCQIDADAALAHIMLSRRIRYPVRQVVNVATLAAQIFERIKHDEVRASAAIAGALCMNICILRLQDALYQQATPLSPDQQAAVRAHPADGVAAMRARDVMNPIWLEVVAQHHEALDGSGFPAGLAEDRICLEAQVIALADRYCGMVTERAYRAGLLPPVVLKDLHARHALAIKPELIHTLIALLGIYPPGTFVELRNRETAVVCRRLADRKHPVVNALQRSDHDPQYRPRKRLTGSNPAFEIVRAVQCPDDLVDFDFSVFWPAVSPVAGAPAQEERDPTL